jgi:putative exosortase-associated protein (TIGR04073 family)
MKKGYWLAIVLLCVFMFSSTVAFAEGTYYDNITHKLGRGICNTLLSPVEMCRSLDYKIDDHGFWAGSFIGSVHGIGRIIGRAVTGAFDIITFPVPVPTFDTYYMEPEFVMINDMTSTA